MAFVPPSYYTSIGSQRNRLETLLMRFGSTDSRRPRSARALILVRWRHESAGGPGGPSFFLWFRRAAVLEKTVL